MLPAPILQVSATGREGATRLVCACAAAALLAICGCGGTGAPEAQQALRLSSASEWYLLAPYCDVLEDPSGQWDAGDVAAGDVAAADPAHRFRPARGRALHLGLSPSVFWVRFRLSYAPDLQDECAVRMVLALGHPNLSSAALFVADEGPGDAEPVRVPQRFMTRGRSPRKLPSFDLPPGGAAARTFYLRVQSEAPLILPLSVSSSQRYVGRVTRAVFWFGLYYGVILIVILMNLVVFPTLRDASRVWYILKMIFFTVFFFGANGILRFYFPAGEAAALFRVMLLSLVLGLFCTAMFARSFLMARRASRLSNRLLLAYSGLAALLIVLGLRLGTHSLNIGYGVLGLAAPVILIAAGRICWVRGYRPARYYLLACAIFSVGQFAYALTYCGLVPYSWLGVHGFQIATALESVLLSVGLADRVFSLRREREEARRGERRYMEMAITDGLTGLYNARHFHDKIGVEIALMQRVNLPLSLIMLDVDDFKDYNDTYGHPEGDVVLGELGYVIISSIRDIDIPCRYGGEEFAILLPDTSGPAATRVAERIRAAFAAVVFHPKPEAAASVTISLGVAEHFAGRPADHLIKRADTALYDAKGTGKNRVVLATGPPTPSRPSATGRAPRARRGS